MYTLVVSVYWFVNKKKFGSMFKSIWVKEQKKGTTGNLANI